MQYVYSLFLFTFDLSQSAQYTKKKVIYHGHFRKHSPLSTSNVLVTFLVPLMLLRRSYFFPSNVAIKWEKIACCVIQIIQKSLKCAKTRSVNSNEILSNYNAKWIRMLECINQLNNQMSILIWMLHFCKLRFVYEWV